MNSFWDIPNIDTKILKQTWTKKPVLEAQQAFQDAGCTVEVIPATLWKTGQYCPEEIYTCNQVNLFLDETDQVDHITEG